MTVREIVDWELEESKNISEGLDAQIVIDETIIIKDEYGEHYGTAEYTVHQVCAGDGVVRLVKGDRIEEPRS